MRRRRRALLLGGVALLVGVPALLWGGTRLLLRDEVLRPRLIAAVEQATGRRLTLSGPLRIRLSLVPAVTLEGVALSNAPGGSRAEMLTARRVEVELALLPLLQRRLAFESLTLVEPDLLLEVGPEGTGNWRFGPPREEAAVPTGGTPPPNGAEPPALSIAAVTVERGRLSWRDARNSWAETLEIRHLSLEAAAPEAPVRFQGSLGLRGLPVGLEGEAGPLPRLLGASMEPAAWPLRLALTAPGLQARLEGTSLRPEAAAGWQVAASASVEDTGRLAPLLPPGLPPPTLRGLALSADLAEGEVGGRPRLLRLDARLASGDAAPWFPGLLLGQSTLSLSGPDARPTLSATLSLRDLPARLEATLPPLAGLGGDAPLPLQATLTAGEASASFNGTLPPRELNGAGGTLALRAPDTAPLLRAAVWPAPRLTEAALSTRLDARADSIRLSGMALQSREAVLEGAGELAFRGGRPSLSGNWRATWLDLDGLLRPPPAEAASGGAAEPPAVPPRPPVPTGANGPRRVIPDLPLPFAALRGADAALDIAVAELILGGVTYRDGLASLRLEDGRLEIAPLALSLPGGRLAGRLAADATAEPPRLAATLRHEGAGLDLRPLMQGFRVPGQASGFLELDADLAGTGSNLRAVAASLGGHFGLALADGQVDGRVLDRLGGELRRLLLPSLPEGGIALRCVALRLGLRDGMARPQAMLAETAVADVVGSGEINLGEERLALRLLPEVRLGGVGITAPVLIGGTFAAPSYRLDQARVPEAAAGILSDLMAQQMESQGALGALAQQLAGRPSGSRPDCAQQLAVVRGGRAGPLPAERPQRVAPRPVNPADILRGLLGR